MTEVRITEDLQKRFPNGLNMPVQKYKKNIEESVRQKLQLGINDKVIIKLKGWKGDTE